MKYQPSLFVYIVPGSAPRSISVADRSPYRLSLMWLPPELSYGIITSYTIRIDFTNGTNAMTRTSTSASLSIPGLQPYQTITVIISAINSQGAGPSSNETSFTTDESRKLECPMTILMYDTLKLLHSSSV